MRFLLISFVLCVFGVGSQANESVSIEAEALEVAEQIKCLVCSDPNIQVAQDETAKDLRFFIRKHLTEGKSQDLVINLMFANYGDMISLEASQDAETNNEMIFSSLVSVVLFLAMIVAIYKKSLLFKQEEPKV